ncbi:MAG: aminopeptidase P family protein [Verrucomicrobia bacterium]|nr:aminopeptidase P family protein [Verrucomicrobiota bacterium]
MVAGGDQACDPHCRGSGPLRPNELIIVDIFPRISRTGYHGDMTRTYLKGTPSEAQCRLVEAVFDAQQQVLKQHGPGVNGRSLYQFVVDTFNARGYATETKDGVSTGFFHGLGHGLGLEVHEPPRVSVADATLQVGQVVTVEPGLYSQVWVVAGLKMSSLSPRKATHYYPIILISGASEESA